MKRLSVLILALGVGLPWAANAQLTGAECVDKFDQALVEVAAVTTGTFSVTCSSARGGGYFVEVRQVCDDQTLNSTAIATINLVPKVLTCDVRKESFDATCPVSASIDQDTLISAKEFRNAKRAISQMCRSLQKNGLP